MLVRIGGTFDENNAVLAELGGRVEFAVGRGKAVGVLPAVFVAQQSQIDVAPLDFLKVNGVGTAVAGGNVFKKECIKETAKQRVAKEVSLERLALGGELLLHAADENPLLHTSGGEFREDAFEHGIGLPRLALQRVQFLHDLRNRPVFVRFARVDVAAG